MRKYLRPLGALLLAAIAAFAVSACGSSSNSSSSSSGGSAGSSTSASAGASGGTINMVAGVYPQSLDPGYDYTTQGAETNWLVYTGLTTYGHGSGKAGETLIPGLATALPKITDGGKTYTVTLRKGQVYSNGAPVKASDFTFTFERAVKIPWGGSGEFMTPRVVGAAAYAAGKAKTISGIVTNDKTGKIVIHLTAPYGAFDNVLAEPALGLIPAGSAPFKNDPLHPPPGDGPYMVPHSSIVVNQAYDVDKNPKWKPLPGIPAGHVNIDVKVSANVTSNAEAVLNNTADVFDWADTIPGSLLPQISSKASSRFKLVNLGGSVYYFFLNSQEKPFNNQLAREAVVTGLNEEAYNREGSGTLAAACFFLPPAVAGHPTTKCPYGTPGTGNLAKAKALVKQSGEAGAKVTVWSETRAPRQQWAATYTQYLNQIGFKATQKIIADATYFSTIGEEKQLHPQTGFADWNQDFPNPIDFYGVLLDGSSILPTNNENFGETNDPKINAEVTKLGVIPTTQLQKNGTAWQKLDEYTAKKAYAAVFGYEKFPFFTSDRMDYSALKLSPIYGWDFDTFQLK